MAFYCAVLDFRDNLARNVEEGNGLVLSGTPGTMKTTLAIALLREHIDSGCAGFLVDMPTLIDVILSTWAVDREGCARFESKLRTTSLLVLDDFGCELVRHNDIAMAKVSAILSERYNRCLSTIFTTNLSLAELAESYDERLVDRLVATCTVLEADFPSLRDRKPLHVYHGTLPITGRMDSYTKGLRQGETPWG